VFLYHLFGHMAWLRALENVVRSFSTSPFMGAVNTILAFGDHATPAFWLAAILMGAAYGYT